MSAVKAAPRVMQIGHYADTRGERSRRQYKRGWGHGFIVAALVAACFYLLR